jgi:hypothetical protein
MTAVKILAFAESASERKDCFNKKLVKIAAERVNALDTEVSY